jgi:uroporphyrinogen III methyltransferase/synthase
MTNRPPLAGKRIVVTRARSQAAGLSERLRELGAEVEELPVIEIRPPADYGPLDRAIGELASYDWIIFTSANGVRVFGQRLRACGGAPAGLGAHVCAIGPATRAAAVEMGVRVDLMPAEYVAEGVVEAFRPFDLAGRRILLPRAAVARDLVPAELARRGARVDVVEAYRTAVPDDAPGRVRDLFAGGRRPDFITFTSTSTVTNFAALAGAETLAGVRVVSIGPVTTGAARALGIDVAAEARVYTIDGVVQAVLDLCKTEKAPVRKGE